MTRLDRRGFVRRCAATAATVGIPLAVPGSALGLGQPAPSERITFGFIGLGWKGFEGCFGSLLQSFIAFKEVQVRAVCDVDRRFCQRARQFVDKRYGREDCAAYNDFRNMIDRSDIDAVVIATPDHWHAVQTIMACTAGKDVYCEKPLSLTIEEARSMVTAARRHARVVQTGSQSRSNPRVRAACELARDGRIGRISEVYAGCGGPSVPCPLPPAPVPDYLDWDMWLGPAPSRPYSDGIHPKAFRSFVDYSGGGVTDWGAHHFDIGQWGLGMDHTGPVEIIPPGNETERLTFKYANGVRMYHSDYEGFGGVTFLGSQGRIAVHGVDGATKMQPESLENEVRGAVARWEDIHANKGHYEDFLDCVRTRRRPAADVEIGCRTVTVCHLANIAYALKRPLKWDPVREEFRGDVEANRMRARSKREPWHV
ncbi:MAG: hypothetical protein A2V70_08365 [Planctomycetes bacterium RBG_13_63_9]|nr:MAG: hypothetical protein A2V70_08365 [Planctomycetes bacterium RBG_13_63_9]